jgi:hypothetical protein
MGSVQSRRNALIYSRYKPGRRVLGTLEHDIVLQDVIEIRVPATKAMEDRDRPIAIHVGHELLFSCLLMHLHGDAS